MFISPICLVHMKVFAKFDKIPSMTLQDTKETLSFVLSSVRTDNVKTVYPPTNTVCGGIIYPPTNTVCGGGYNKSLVVRKPVFGVSEQVRHKPGCTATEDGKRLGISYAGSRGITAKLICVFVFAYVKSRFSHDTAHKEA